MPFPASASRRWTIGSGVKTRRGLRYRGGGVRWFGRVGLPEDGAQPMGKRDPFRQAGRAACTRWSLHVRCPGTGPPRGSGFMDPVGKFGKIMSGALRKASRPGRPPAWRSAGFIPIGAVAVVGHRHRPVCPLSTEAPEQAIRGTGGLAPRCRSTAPVRGFARPVGQPGKVTWDAGLSMTNACRAATRWPARVVTTWPAAWMAAPGGRVPRPDGDSEYADGITPPGSSGTGPGRPGGTGGRAVRNRRDRTRTGRRWSKLAGDAPMQQRSRDGRLDDRRSRTPSPPNVARDARRALRPAPAGRRHGPVPAPRRLATVQEPGLRCLPPGAPTWRHM